MSSLSDNIFDQADNKLSFKSVRINKKKFSRQIVTQTVNGEVVIQNVGRTQEQYDATLYCTEAQLQNIMSAWDVGVKLKIQKDDVLVNNAYIVEEPSFVPKSKNADATIRYYSVGLVLRISHV